MRQAGLGPVAPAAWHAAAARLEAAVPRLTGGQVVAGMAQLVSMLHDDETLVEFPRGLYLALDAQWVGSGLYLLAVPAADRALLHSLGLAASTASATLTVMTPEGTKETVRLRRGREPMGNPGRRHQADAGPGPGRR